jgi:hypothetical protein
VIAQGRQDTRGVFNKGKERPVGNLHCPASGYRYGYSRNFVLRPFRSIALKASSGRGLGVAWAERGWGALLGWGRKGGWNDRSIYIQDLGLIHSGLIFFFVKHGQFCEKKKFKFPLNSL